MNLEMYGVQEMSTKQMTTTNGGGLIEYLMDGTGWSGTGNPILYFGEATYNAMVVAYNGIRLGNALTSASVALIRSWF
jgi:hypothetical protein